MDDIEKEIEKLRHIDMELEQVIAELEREDTALSHVAREQLSPHLKEASRKVKGMLSELGRRAAEKAKQGYSWMRSYMRG